LVNAAVAASSAALRWRSGSGSSFHGAGHIMEDFYCLLCVFNRVFWHEKLICLTQKEVCQCDAA
jgi:hypothetical protein